MSKQSISILIVTITLLLVSFGYVKFFRKTASNINVPVVTDLEKQSDAGSEASIARGIYTNKTYNFSLHLPDGANANQFREGEGEVVLIQSNANAQFSMQIYITAFDENTSLTTARIRADIPDIKMDEPIEIKTDSIPTVAFFSNDGDTKYREIWFVRNGFLFQVLALASTDTMTAKVMESWKWN